MKKIAVLLALAACLTVVAGCNQQSARLVGTWVVEGEKEEEIIEFFSDKTGIMKQQFMGSLINNSLKWNVVDDGRIKMDVTFPIAGTTTIMARLENERLTVDLNPVKKGMRVYIKAK